MRWTWFFRFQAILFLFLASATCDAAGPVTMTRWEQQPKEVRVTSDKKGGALAAWIAQDSSGSWVGAQQVNVNGKEQWGMFGMRIGASAAGLKELRAVPDHSGGAVFVWEEETAGSVRYWMNGVTGRGDLRWPDPGVLIASPTAASSAMAVDVDEKGRIFLAWEELDGDHSLVHCQSFDAMGQAKWPNGHLLAIAHSDLATPAIVSDREGGFFLVWHSSDPASALYRGQYIDTKNHIVWETYGRTISTQQASHPVLQNVSYTTDGELLLIWKVANQAEDTWTAQSLNANGQKRWGDEGISLNYQKGEQENASLSVDRTGKMTMAWEDAGSTPSKVFLQQWDRKGLPLWDISGVAASPERDGEQRDPVVVAEDSDAFLLWIDNFDHPWELYAQRMNSHGEPAWRSGSLVTPAGPFPKRPLGASDFSGGLFTFWLEQSPSLNWQLQILRISGSGAAAW